jgi:uncharacterized membrane protein YebE (DUF533 family)
MAAHAERWLGILAGGVLTGREDEEAAEEAVKVVGEAKLSELREWFAGKSRDERQAAEAAVIEACIAMMHSNRVVKSEERALVDAVIARADLDAAHRAALEKAIEHPPKRETIASRVPHPVLRELLLVLAWELAKADGHVDDDERGEYGLLAALLGVDKERAAALRTALGG